MATYLERLIARVLWYTLGLISLFTSLLTPVVIRRMKTWNGTLMLVVSLSWTLAIYSLGLLLTFLDKSNAICQLQGSLIYFGGISSALWTTCFSTTLLLLVIGVKFHGITQIFKYYFAVATGVPLILTCVVVSQGVIGRDYLSCFVESDSLIFQDIYDGIIFASVMYNIIFFMYCWYRIGRMGGANSPSAKALKEACIRMMYYPIGQSLCWIFIWLTFFIDTGRNEANPNKVVPLVLDSISSPSFGLVMFIVFCLQHPTAYRAIKDLLIPKCLRFFHRKESEAIDLSMDSTDSASSSGVSKTAQIGSTRPSLATQTDLLRKEAQKARGVGNSGDTKPSGQEISKLTELSEYLIDDEFVGLHLPEDDTRDSHAIFRQSDSTTSRPTVISMVSRGSTATTGTNSLSQSLIANQHTQSRSISVNGSLASVAPVKIDSAKSTSRKSLGGTPTKSYNNTNSSRENSTNNSSSLSASFLNFPSKMFGGSQTPNSPSNRMNSRSTSRSSSVARSSVSSKVTGEGRRTISRDANFSYVDEEDLFRMIQEPTVFEDSLGKSGSGKIVVNSLLASGLSNIVEVEGEDDESSVTSHPL